METEPTEKSAFQDFTDAVESHNKYHSPDCEHAHTPRCRCWCAGKYHGAKSGILAKIDGSTIDREMIEGEQVITIDMGGQAGELIKTYSTKKFQCGGICHQDIAASPVIGYPHDGGHPDSTGKRWWLFVRCPYCHYDTSVMKILKRIVAQ